MPKIDDAAIREIVTGRIVPHIYSFETNTLPNYLKVGDTYRPVEERLSEWRKYYKDLTEVSRHEATVENKVFFRDYAVHKYLEANSFTRLRIDKFRNIYSSEFFQDATKDDVSAAVADIKANYKKTTTYDYYDSFHDRVEFHFERTETFDPRDNQQHVIDNFQAAVAAKRTNLLMYAVMRFGKSITSMWCAKSIDAKLTVIVSAKADVVTEWKETVETHIDFTGYRFMDSDDLRDHPDVANLYGKNFITGNGKEETCTNVVIFLTLQDLAGSSQTIKRHHSILRDANVDLLIIDETHFGARAKVLGKLLAGTEIDEDEEDSLKPGEDPEDLGNLHKLEAIRAKVKIHLSGTPYRILMGSEFEQEDIIAFVQFSDIYKAKLAWSAEHLDEDEWKNPYYGFPQMVRFAFNPNESSRKLLSSLQDSMPSKLFAPRSIKKDSRHEYEKFIHEQEVIDMLQVLDGSKEDKELLGLLDNPTIKAGKLTRHIVIVLPHCSSCDALEKLIANNRNLFKNFAEYKILNIAGHNKILEESSDIKSTIKNVEASGQKTITLTVNKMLTGTTVKQWDTMIYLKGTMSPQEYDQAIFRLQSPWVDEYRDERNKAIKYDMKPQTLLVDLDPTRLFYLQERKAFTYGVNTRNHGTENIESFIERELSVSPVITINAEQNKLVEITASNIIDAVRKYSSERSIYDDVNEIGIDLSLKSNEDIYALINGLSELGSKSGLTVKPAEGEGDDMEGGTQGPNGDSDSANTHASGEEKDEDSSDDKSFEKRFRTYYALILLFAFLSTTEEKSLADVIKNIEASIDNQRIAKNLGLKKHGLTLIRDHINDFALRELDYKIRNSDFRATDSSMSDAQRMDTAIHKFGRLSEAEIFTPSSIVDKVYEGFSEDFWETASTAKILDIGSKSGNFMKGFVTKAAEHGFDPQTLRDNLYSIPTSHAAYEFTRKMYNALGLNIDNIAEHINSFDLATLNIEDVKYLLTQDKKFCDIALSDLSQRATITDENSEGNVKFAAVVGNPPYQIDTDTNFSTPVFHRFIEAAKSLNPDYVAMIHPARFLFDGGATPKKWNRMMLNDPHLSVPFYEPDAQKVFSGVGFKGGVCITFWDKNHETGGLGGSFVANEQLRGILNKTKRGGFNEIVGSRGETKLTIALDKKYPKDLRIAPNYFDRFPEVFLKHKDKKHNIKIVGLEKGNRRTDRYVDGDIVKDPKLNRWKVFIPKSSGSGTFGEVISTPLIGEPSTGCTYSFLQVGSYSDESAAQNCLKYIKTKFCRAMLGTLKSTQDNPRSVWKNVPAIDLETNSVVDWSKSIADIDAQLYKKYDLSKDEIDFIESRVKAME